MNLFNTFFAWTRDNQMRFANAISELLNKTAPSDSPTFTGVPTAPTADAGTETDQIATTAFVADKVSKTGDTITGKIKFQGQARTNARLALVADDDSEITLFPQSYCTCMLIEKSNGGTYHFGFTSTNAGAFYALNFGSTITKSLGSTTYPWDKIFVKEIVNGETITVPEKAGTLALLSDVEEMLTAFKQQWETEHQTE